MFPGTDYLDDIEVGGQRVGHVDYGINPLDYRLYINMLEIDPAQQRQGIGLAVLCTCGARTKCRCCRCISTPHPMGSGTGHGAVIEDELRGEDQMALEQQRWQHLVPEPDHLRQIRELQASPVWPAIKARISAGEAS
ncbi:GNAT family N-acetyltransferase [Pseudomonas sp. MPB26]|uniref:GNAT family N-acetyltransferase n=1 Tax=Pseudomonas sp. MPB26 TaxID=3388491 RepID=UPI003984D5CB